MLLRFLVALLLAIAEQALAAECEPAVIDRLRPLHRWRSDVLTEHFYVLDEPPLPLLPIAQLERVEGFVLPTPEPGTLALHRLRKPQARVGVYAARPEALDLLVNHLGFVDFGIEGYLFASPGPGRVPLRALWSAGTTDFLLTGDEEEILDATTGGPGPGFVDLGVEGYAAPFFSIGEPSGAHEGQAPRGTMMLVHGGAWQDEGETSAASDLNLADAARWRDRGWRTLAVSYRPSREGPANSWPALLGAAPPVVPGSATRSIEDVTWFYDEVRRWLGPDIPVCASGWSSGGHLALLLASLRPSLDCVVAQAAPTDLPALRSAGTIGGLAAEFAFGSQSTTPPADAFSPVAVVEGIQARLLLATAENDTWVPPSQMDALRTAMAGTGKGRNIATLRLRDGPHAFWHGTVSTAALAELRRAEDRLANEVTSASR